MICHPPGVYIRPSLQNCAVEDLTTKSKLHELLLMCWAEEKTERPNIDHISEEMDSYNIQKSVTSFRIMTTST